MYLYFFMYIICPHFLDQLFSYQTIYLLKHSIQKSCYLKYQLIKITNVPIRIVKLNIY